MQLQSSFTAASEQLPSSSALPVQLWSLTSTCSLMKWGWAVTIPGLHHLGLHPLQPEGQQVLGKILRGFDLSMWDLLCTALGVKGV